MKTPYQFAAFERQKQKDLSKRLPVNGLKHTQGGMRWTKIESFPAGHSLTSFTKIHDIWKRRGNGGVRI